MKLMLLVGLSAVFVSCSTGVKRSHSEGGKEIFEAKCNGTAHSLADCRKQASQVCNGYFAVVGSERTNAGSYNTASANAYGNTAQASGVSINGIKRSMMFYCTNGEVGDLKRVK